MSGPALSVGRIHPSARFRRWFLGILIAVAVLAAAVVVAMHLAARTLKEKIVTVLGPESTVGEITVQLTSIEILSVEVPAPKGWPTKKGLSAERIVVVPELRQLLSDRIHITRIDVHNAQIAVLRPKQGGLQVLPHLARRTQKTDRRTGTETRGADIDVVNLHGCVIDLYDQTVVLSRQRIRTDAVTGKLEDIQVPELAGKMQVDLKGTIRGSSHNGSVAVRGWTNVAAKDSQLALTMKNVDPSVFGPYFLAAAKTKAQTGLLDVEFKSTVRKGTIHAPGTLTLTNLKLEGSDNPLAAFAEIPRRAVIGALADEHDRITVNFLVHGSTEDPQVDVEGGTGLRAGVVIAKALGFSVVGVLRALVLIFYGIGSALTSAVQG